MTTKTLKRLISGPPIRGRYLYSYRGESFGRVLGTFLNTRDGHTDVIAGFNQRDQGEWRWRWEECFPGDIDYPQSH